MSFILDALKKSESERQRQSGPALFEVKIAPPRSRFATWGAAIGALLIVNVVVVGIVLWRGSASHAAAPAAPLATAVPAAPAASGVPPVAAQPPTPDVRFGARTPIAAPPSTAGTTAATAAAAGTAEGPSPPASAPKSAGDAAANPDDLAPAVEPHQKPAAPATGIVHATESGLPTYQDAAAEPGANIPSLSLDLHVYSQQPDQRFVFLNMMKLREGDASPQGVRVEHITPDGVILSYQGKQFVLQRH